MKNDSILQFKMTLQEIEPALWRRIQIAEQCSFWDLHVAIQDAMGWKDCHLHHFEVIDPDTSEKQLMGIPDEDGFDDNTLPGWDYRVVDYVQKNNQMIYLYDYGDSWYHLIECEGLQEKLPDKKYPVCLAGERACPPEDVGSIPGYYDFVAIMKDKNHEEYPSMKAWFGEGYDPEKFDAKKVTFHNPNVRWKQSIGIG